MMFEAPCGILLKTLLIRRSNTANRTLDIQQIKPRVRVLALPAVIIVYVECVFRVET